MLKLHFTLIAVPLVLRHAHHFWCTRHTGRRRGKQGMVSVAVWFACYVALLTGTAYRLLTDDAELWAFWMGAALLWIACAGRMISIHQLGKAFSEFIYIGPEQRLVDTGIYAYIRHPLHYFLLLEMIAMAVIAGGAWAWGLIAAAAITLVFRERDEERALEAAFGEAYRAYRKRAAALIDIIPLPKGRGHDRKNSMM